MLDKYLDCSIIRYMPNNKLDKYAGIFKALSNPNRLKIFISLATCCKPGTIGVFAPDNTGIVEIQPVDEELEAVIREIETKTIKKHM